MKRKLSDIFSRFSFPNNKRTRLNESGRSIPVYRPYSTTEDEDTGLDEPQIQTHATTEVGRVFVCDFCPYEDIESLEQWSVYASGKKRIFHAHTQCIQNIPEVNMATANGFNQWAIISESEFPLFRARRRLRCSLCSNIHGTKHHCIIPGCTEAYHITCAILSWITLFEPVETSSHPYKLLCGTHAQGQTERWYLFQDQQLLTPTAIRSAALMHAKANDLIHIRIADDRGSDYGTLDRPALSQRVYIVDVNIQEQTVDISPWPLTGNRTCRISSINTIRWDEVVVNDTLSSLIPDIDLRSPKNSAMAYGFPPSPNYAQVIKHGDIPKEYCFVKNGFLRPLNVSNPQPTSRPSTSDAFDVPTSQQRRSTASPMRTSPPRLNETLFSNVNPNPQIGSGIPNTEQYPNAGFGSDRSYFDFPAGEEYDRHIAPQSSENLLCNDPASTRHP